MTGISVMVNAVRENTSAVPRTVSCKGSQAGNGRKGHNTTLGDAATPRLPRLSNTGTTR